MNVEYKNKNCNTAVKESKCRPTSCASPQVVRTSPRRNGTPQGSRSGEQDAAQQARGDQCPRVLWQKGGKPAASASVKCTTYGNYIDITTITGARKNANVIKLNKDEYVVVKTGEIRKYNTSADKKMDNIRRAKRELKRTLIENFSAQPCEAMITLTYKENMQDKEKLSYDWKILSKWIKRYIGTEIAYIAIIELQRRGAYHLHIPIKRVDGYKLIIPQAELQAHWQHGTADIRRTNKNTCEYLSGYFEKTYKAVRSLKQEKYTKLYHCSKNIKKPGKFYDVFKNVAKKYPKEINSAIGKIYNDKGETVTCITQTRAK